MDAFVTACVLLYIVTGLTVGIRLLRIAFRTKRLPEAALGMTLFCFAALSQPAAVLEAMARQQGLVGYSGIAGVVAWIGTYAALCGLAVFTWQAFRPTERWAAAFCAFIIAGDTFAIGTLLRNIAIGNADLVENGRVIALSCGAFAAAFGWGALAGWFAWDAARTRERLGLADSVVKNRFMLWGLSSFGGLVADLLLIPLLLAGADLTKDAAPRLAVAFSALLNAVCWYLAFAPPPAYTRWLTAEPARG
jgi:hypothetical protein